MNTKEAIEFLEYIVKDLLIDEIGRCNFSGVDNVKSQVNNIIKLLQQGEAYKNMWEEFLDLPLGYFVKPSDWELYLFRIRELEEKYFPERESDVRNV